MKAKVKKTGEIIEVVPDSTNRYYHDSESGTLVYGEVDLQFDFTDDWQQVRIQAAIAAMQGILSDEEVVGYACSEATYKENEKHTIPVAVARFAAACADALIIELKEKGGSDEE